MHRKLVLALTFWTLASSTPQAQQPNPNGMVLIRNTFPPIDSRGENLYAFQGKYGYAKPVDGKLVMYEAIKTVLPKFSNEAKKEMRGTKSAKVTVVGVIASNGDFIDAQVENTPGPETSRCVIDAIHHYQLHPATLDGNPIAVVVRFEVAVTTTEVHSTSTIHF